VIGFKVLINIEADRTLLHFSSIYWTGLVWSGHILCLTLQQHLNL